MADKRAADWGPDMRERVARKKLGNPEDFKFYGYEAIEAGDVKMTGCVTTRMFTKGPRKGQPAYEGKPRSVVVSKAEIRLERDAYELSTGRCGDCLGDGLEMAGWSRAGTIYRPCPRCTGSGSAQRQEAAIA